MSTSHPSLTWYQESFNEDYRTIYPGRDRAQAEFEVDAVIRELQIQPGETVLDLCCGFGRHLEAFSRRRIQTVGIDLSLPLLRQASSSPETRLVCGDMRRLPFAAGEEGFSVLVNFFTSFGYFETEEENGVAAEEMGRVLRAGGRFLMDLMNAGPTIRHLVPRTERRQGPFHVLEERRHDPVRRRIEKRVTLSSTTDGKVREYFESVRVYSHDEIVALLSSVGLKVERALGDFSGAPHGEDSPRMILLGTKLET